MWFTADVPYPVCLLRGLVPWWQHNITASVPRGRAAGCGFSGGGGARAADVLLWISGIAAAWELGAASQERIAVPAPRSGPLTAPALEAGPTPHRACIHWALASCRRNHRSREAVRVRAAGPRGILRGRGGGTACGHYGGRWGGRRGGGGGAREGEAFTLLLEHLFQSQAKNPHALLGVLAHFTERRVLWLRWGPLQPWILRSHCVSSNSRTWTGTHPLWLPLIVIPLLHVALLTSNEHQRGIIQWIRLLILPSLSVRHAGAHNTTTTVEERLEYSRGERRTVEVEMGLTDRGFDRLSDGQGDESKEGACISDSGTRSHAGLVQRERRWIMRG